MQSHALFRGLNSFSTAMPGLKTQQEIGKNFFPG